MTLSLLIFHNFQDILRGEGHFTFLGVGMCRADFTRRSWNWNGGLKGRVIGTEKGGKLVYGTKISADFELILGCIRCH